MQGTGFGEIGQPRSLNLRLHSVFSLSAASSERTPIASFRPAPRALQIASFRPKRPGHSKSRRFGQLRKNTLPHVFPKPFEKQPPALRNGIPPWFPWAPFWAPPWLHPGLHPGLQMLSSCPFGGRPDSPGVPFGGRTGLPSCLFGGAPGVSQLPRDPVFLGTVVPGRVAAGWVVRVWIALSGCALPCFSLFCFLLQTGRCLFPSFFSLVFVFVSLSLRLFPCACIIASLFYINAQI